MLQKIKNLTNSQIIIIDLGITISSGEYYNLSGKKYSQSEDLILNISNGSLLFVKSESPEELYDIASSLQYLVNGIVHIPKTTNSGENITLKNEYGHLSGNNIINWTFTKYLSNGDSLSEKMHIPLEKTITLNSFSSGSFNISSSAVLEYYEFNSEFNEDIRLNRDIRLQEYYMSEVTTAPDQDTIKLIVSNIENFDIGLIYQIGTVDDVELFRRVVDVDIEENSIILNIPISNNVGVNAKISLIDRAISYNDSQLSNNVIEWISPLRITGISNSYLKITIINEDDSEPGEINCSINGWIGNI